MAKQPVFTGAEIEENDARDDDVIEITAERLLMIFLLNPRWEMRDESGVLGRSVGQKIPTMTLFFRILLFRCLFGDKHTNMRNRFFFAPLSFFPACVLDLVLSFNYDCEAVY